MEKTAKNVFFELLRIGLWNKKPDTDLPKLNTAQWEKIYTWAQQQTVEGILFESFALLSENNLPPREIRIKWAVRVDQIERYNKQMNKLISSQYQNFISLHLKPILLKGQGVANCYQNPLRRV